MRILLLTFLIHLFGVCAFAQVISYDRAGLTVLLTDNSPSVLKSRVSSIDLGDGYDLNRVPLSNVSGGSKATIASSLRAKKVAAASLNDLRDIDELISRVEYNLNDAVVSRLKKTVRGVSTARDEAWIETIVRNNYVLVLEVREVLSIDEFYDRQELGSTVAAVLSGGGAATIKRSNEGYFAKVTAHVFHIQLDEAAYARFWEYWENDSKHRAYDYPIQHVLSETVWVDGTQSKSAGDYSDLNQLLLDKGTQRLLNHLGKDYFPLAQKVPISNTRPIRAKIGEKEGVYPNQRFFVYELQEKKSGEVQLKRKGVVRARKVVNNRYVATGSSASSSFYQVNYGKVKGGMYLVANEDKGVVLTLGASEYPYREYKGTIGFDLARRFSLSNLYNWRLYLALGYAPDFEDANPFFDDYAAENGSSFLDARRMSSFNYGVGLEKDLYILPMIQLTPFLSLHQEFMSYKDRSTVDQMIGNGELLRGYGTFWNFQFGLRLPVNLTHNVKLVPTLGYTTRNISTTTSAGGAAGFQPSRITTAEGYLADLQLRIEF
jgi:hypothetical protein